MTIGEVIDALEKAKPDAVVFFSFGGCDPTTIDSWRGIYSEAALGFKDGGRGGESVKVEALLAELRKAIDGRTYTGWKGGDFTYSRSTPLHIDNPGCYTSTELFRIENDDWAVYLHTARENH